MATTKNYGLYVTAPSDNVRVQTWRNQLCGDADSNMVKIDKALAALDAKSLPPVTASDEDKILKVTGGVWAAVDIGSVYGSSY